MPPHIDTKRNKFNPAPLGDRRADFRRLCLKSLILFRTAVMAELGLIYLTSQIK